MTQTNTLLAATTALRAILTAFAGRKWAVVATWRDEDDGEPRSHATWHTTREVVRRLWQDYGKRKVDDWGDHVPPYNWAGLVDDVAMCRAIVECYDYTDTATLAFTEAGYASWKQEKERKRLEELAADIAARYEVEVNSPAFLDACVLELNRLQEYREGMKEDGLCIGYGVTADQWNEEHTASQGDSATVRDVLDYMHRYFPLLYAGWKEKQEG